mmetsp:Transcript_48714/g.154350  ORF Transcript_48714/g.154350 Transcript_48714/m.154350 type:complete len:225 (-) Transcript_48714:1905-2579(-)
MAEAAVMAGLAAATDLTAEAAAVGGRRSRGCKESRRSPRCLRRLRAGSLPAGTMHCFRRQTQSPGMLHRGRYKAPGIGPGSFLVLFADYGQVRSLERWLANLTDRCRSGRAGVVRLRPDGGGTARARRRWKAFHRSARRACRDGGGETTPPPCSTAAPRDQPRPARAGCAAQGAARDATPCGPRQTAPLARPAGRVAAGGQRASQKTGQTGASLLRRCAKRRRE